jgi:Predicted pPIWI-associating nuclease
VGTAENRSDSWTAFVEALGVVERAIGRVSAVNVNTASAREAARDLIQGYFRRTRPDLVALGIRPEDLSVVDESMQTLLQLANGRNAKSSYRRVLRGIRAEVQDIELGREYRIGEQRHSGAGSGAMISDIESRILATLRDLVPTAALSYEQAIRDLGATDRISYRGTANELREALRETVDRLSPDDEVMAAQGFKLERNQTKPTQKQKVRHILRSRSVSATARKTPEDTVTLVEELTSSVARSTSERSSLATHVASTEREVRQIKMWVDGVLAELLQVHGP